MPIKTTIDVHSLISKQPVRTNAWNKHRRRVLENPPLRTVELLKKKKKKTVQFPFARIDDFDLRFRNICSIKV